MKKEREDIKHQSDILQMIYNYILNIHLNHGRYLKQHRIAIYLPMPQKIYIQKSMLYIGSYVGTYLP